MSSYAAVTAVGKRGMDAIAANPGGVLLASDYDGTLAPIVDDPDLAFPLPAAVDALARLGGLLGGVAIITGREVQSAVKLGAFEGRDGLGALRVLGQYGVERWTAEDGRYVIPPVPPAITEVSRELPNVLQQAGYPGARVEQKRRALGVHTRELPDPQAALEALRDPLTQLAIRHGLDVEPGRFVLEIRAGQCDKGRALRTLVSEIKPSIVVYCGDDLGDVPAFEALDDLRARGIAGIGVCSASEEQPALAEFADILAAGPAGVAAFLTALADAIELRGEPGPLA